MIKYGKSISQAFSALKRPGLWGFALSAEIIVIVPMTFAFTYYMSKVTALMRLAGEPGLAELKDILLALGVISVASLVTLPVVLLRHGGMVQLSNRAVAGERVSVADGWREGARMMGRTLGIEFLIGLAMFVFVLAVTAPFVAMIIISAAAGDTGGEVAAVFAACCGVLVFFAALMLGVSVLTAWEAIAIRYGVVGGRTFGDAAASAARAFRARFKNVFVFGLIVFGIQYAYQTVATGVLYPVQMLLYGPSLFSAEGPDPARMVMAMPVIYLLSYALVFPMQVFYYNLWSAAFRQLTELDSPAPEADGFPDAPPMPPAGMESGPQPESETRSAEEGDD